MKALTLLPLLQAAADEEVLTFGEIVADLPHDAASIFVYILIIVSVGVVIRTGRQKKKSPDA